MSNKSKFLHNPLISIVTPSFNQATYLEDNIKSVMAQTWRNIEHIVLDGGSTDDTVSVLKKYENNYNLIWSSAKDDGQSDAINKGFELANGEIVYWLNSDDALLKQAALEKVVSIFNEHLDADILYGDRIVVNGEGELIKLQYTNRFDYQKLCDGIIPIFQENVFFRRSVVKSDKINTNLKVVMDTDYWIRLGAKYRFHYVPHSFALFRIHDSNKTVSNDFAEIWNEEKDYLRSEYGIKRFKVARGAQPLRYWHRIKCLSGGAYNNYSSIISDILALSKASDLTVPVTVKPQKIVSYITNSFLPYTR